MREINHITKFLELNGYTKEKEKQLDTEILRFIKGNLSVIEINDDEVVFIDDNGDFLHLPINFYCVLGALIHIRELPVNYNYVNPELIHN